MSTKRSAPRRRAESDGAYVLKLVVYVVLGSLWIRLAHPLAIGDFQIAGFPLGFFLGLIFASHDHFQIDRKIEYALLVIMMIVTYFLPAGIVI